MGDHQSTGVNAGQFRPGQPRPAGSGRQKGTLNRQTALVRAGLETAVQTLRDGTAENFENPVQAAFKIARLIEGLTAKRLAHMQDAMGQLPKDEYDRLTTGLKVAADIHLKLAEFAFPKLARIDLAGEAPAVPVHQKTIVTLRIPRPGTNGAATIEHDALEAGTSASLPIPE
jgi:hypothetical protein